MKKLIFICCLFQILHATAQLDSINQKDASGLRQGKWILLGSDVPEAGVTSTGIAEEGSYLNNQKIGAWKRYDKNGTTPNALIYYAYNANGNTSNRVGIFPYKYDSDGHLLVLPYPGKCPTKANTKRFNEKGELIELTEYDSLCNESLIVSAMDSSSIAQLPYFEIPMSFKKTIENGNVGYRKLSMKEQNGSYLIDFDHRVFQTGTFKNGELWNGKECVLDESMNLLSARVFSNGKYIASYLP